MIIRYTIIMLYNIRYTIIMLYDIRYTIMMLYDYMIWHFITNMTKPLGELIEKVQQSDHTIAGIKYFPSFRPAAESDMI